MAKQDLSTKLLTLAHETGKVIKVFDTETTGLGATDDIIQFSGVSIKADTWEEIGREDFFINIGKPLSPKITELTGITDAMLSTEGISKEEACERIKAFFADDIISGYNLSFDIRKVNYLYSTVLGEPFVPTSIIDVYKLVKDFCPKTMTVNQKLSTMTEFYNLNEGLSFHRAIDDVIATIRLMQRLHTEYISGEKIVANTITDNSAASEVTIENVAEQPITVRPVITTQGTAPVTVTKIARWTKSQSLDRLYIEFVTQQNGLEMRGRIFYDYVDGKFKEQETNMIPFINMYQLEIQVFDLILLSGVYRYADYQ